MKDSQFTATDFHLHARVTLSLQHIARKMASRLAAPSAVSWLRSGASTQRIQAIPARQARIPEEPGSSSVDIRRKTREGRRKGLI